MKPKRFQRHKPVKDAMKYEQGSSWQFFKRLGKHAEKRHAMSFKRVKG